MYKDYQAEATGHLVVQAADALGVPLTRAAAMPLFAAIATDTGWFRFGSVTAETYRVIARLVDVGVVPSEVYGDLYERDTLGRLKLRGLILSRTTSELDGDLMHTYVQREDFAVVGANQAIQRMLLMQLFRYLVQRPLLSLWASCAGGFKLSFRSRCHLDCNEVARQFGGGGHKAAAGAFQEGTLEEVQDRVLSVVRQMLTQQG